ncbi:Tetratricopeptide repeat protein 36 [Actinomortierella ambigua]|uniref:Tetratricopeptide repeat protein 36 n=1 Tax=Actinomortierella ambigua TaxID=1343610 RepID=A0A9P6PT86_9FUNG|nr:Tetratricopeptide repeat protein 36 [Actinomortierella ambigua]KAG0251555.1 Tetratricopeptide repeat protein 36 [Actinomortierella ambigua]
MSTGTAVSGHDARILDMVFNPEGTMQPDRENQDSQNQKPVVIEPELLKKVQKLEQESILLAEKDDVEGAVEELTKAIELCPQYASAYNNRAQAYRILKNDDAALADLDLAIRHGTGQPDILKQAYTQRGIIKKLRGDKEEAQIDFELGARYGNPVAKAVSVQDNPISQLCGAMVRDMLSAEINKNQHQ